MKIKLPFTNYRLTRKYEVKDDMENETAGYTDIENQVIYISERGNDKYVKQVLFHEITHGLLFDAGFFDASLDESLVDALSKQIQFLIEKNDMKKIYEYLGLE